MELTISDKTLRKILIGVVIAAVILLIVNAYFRRSNYRFPTTDTAQEDTTLNTNIQTCQTTYSQAILNGTDETTAKAALRTCVSGHVTTYVQAKCPFTNGEEPPSTNTTAKAAWDVYQRNIAAIRSAYVPMVNSANSQSFPIELIQAARKADLTGATRQYLATVCPSTTGPGFYTPADYGVSVTTDATTGQSTISETTVTYPDPVSTKYKAWSTSSTDYGFDQARITQANIQAWGLGAGVIPDGSTAPTGALVASGTKYDKVSSAGIPNWVIARDFGPGTVGTSVPVTYIAAGSSTASKTNVTLPYTYAS